MAEESKLMVETRTESGSNSARRLRREGVLPGVLNMVDGKSVMVKLGSHGFAQMLHHHTSENIVIDTVVDGGEPLKVLIKDVQHDPVTGNLVHVDLYEVSMTEKMKVKVPVELVGEPVGVVTSGGILEHLVRDIEIECLPGDLIDVIEVDVSALEIGMNLHVSDIVVDSKLTIMTSGGIAVASVTAQRIEEEPEEGEGAEGLEGAEGDEPAVVGEKKEESASDENKSDGDK